MNQAVHVKVIGDMYAIQTGEAFDFEIDVSSENPCDHFRNDEIMMAFIEQEIAKGYGIPGRLKVLSFQKKIL